MIIADNSVPSQQEFDQLLIDTLVALNELSRQDTGRCLLRRLINLLYGMPK